MPKLNKNLSAAKKSAVIEKQAPMSKDAFAAALSQANYKLDLIRNGIFNALVSSSYAKDFPVLGDVAKLNNLVDDLNVLIADLIKNMKITFNERGENEPKKKN